MFPPVGGWHVLISIYAYLLSFHTIALKSPQILSNVILTVNNGLKVMGQGSTCSLIVGTILIFVGRSEEKPEKMSG
jgi:hypothetical protein